jgi:hypothetical protein
MVDDLVAILQIAIPAIAAAAPVALVIIAIAGGRRGSLSDLFASAADLTWPPGVQEGDCPHWDVAPLEQGAASRGGGHVDSPEILDLYSTPFRRP